ncbi:MAG: hypothetical protein ACRDTX_13155 [Pseudonocardiaceae bacterium]
MRIAVDRPAIGVLGPVMPCAVRIDVVLVGGSGAVDGVVRFAMVQVTAVSGTQTRGKAAGRGPGDDQVTQCGRWPVDGGAVIGGRPGGRIGEDAPPGALCGEFSGLVGGDGPVAGQLAGLLVEPEQGAERGVNPLLGTM